MSNKLLIDTLEFKNFLSYGDYITKCKISDLGPVLIVGQVNDDDDNNGNDSNNFDKSNGAGKSSFLAAIIWCLFGRTVNNPSPGDKIINWFTGKDCYVKITTTDGWEITRTRNLDGNSDLTIFNNDNDHTVSTNKNAQVKLEELFGLNYDIFISSIFCGQFGKSFLEMAPVKRKETIEFLLGLDKLNNYAEIAKSKCDKIEKKQIELNTKIDILNADLKRQETRSIDNKSAEAKFENDRKIKIDTLLCRSANIDIDISKIDIADYDILKSKWDLIDEINAKLEAYKNKIKLNDTKIIYHKKSIDDGLNKLETYKNWDVPSINLDDLNAEHEKYNDSLNNIKKLTKLLIDYRSDASYIDKEIAALKSSIESWNNKIDLECDSCGQNINEKHAQNKICEYNEILKSKNLIKSDIIEKINGIENSIDKLKNVKRPHMSIDDAKRAVEMSNNILIEVDRVNDLIKSDTESLASIQAENRKLELLISACTEKLVECAPKKTLVEAQNDIHRVNALKTEKENILNKIEDIKNEVNPYSVIADNIDKSIKTLVAEIELKSNEVNSFNNLFDHYKYIHKSYFDRTKIKRLILSELIPYLNDRIWYYSNMLNVNITVKFTSSLSIETDKWGYDFCSGGERKRIDLAVMFGLYDLYIALYGQQCNIMVLDEVDSKLDKDGVESFANIVNAICNGSDDKIGPSTVFVISHKSELGSIFPTQMIVRKSDNFSHIEQEIR